jgi:hypothetical protein
MGGSPSLKTLFLSLFWKRFRHAFSLEMWRQASRIMGFFVHVRAPQLAFNKAENLLVRTWPTQPRSRLSGMLVWLKRCCRVMENEEGALTGCAYWQGQGLPGSGVKRASRMQPEAAAERLAKWALE